MDKWYVCKTTRFIMSLKEDIFVVFLKDKILEILNVDVFKTKKSRKDEYVFARYLFIAVLRKFYNRITVTQIGDILDKDHSTITYSLKVIRNLLEFDKRFQNSFEMLINQSTIFIESHKEEIKVLKSFEDKNLNVYITVLKNIKENFLLEYLKEENPSDRSHKILEDLINKYLNPVEDLI